MEGQMTDLEALTVTLWGEGRGEPIEGKIGIAQVIRERVETGYKGAKTYVEVCTAHAQFSAWTEEAAQMKAEAIAYTQGKIDAVTELCREIAAATIEGKLADNTNGANHYFNPSEVQPEWATDAPVLAELGHHVFINVD